MADIFESGGQVPDTQVNPSIFNQVLRLAVGYVAAGLAVGVALTALYTFYGEELRQFDFGQQRVAVFVGIAALLIALGVALPLWRSRQRHAQLARSTVPRPESDIHGKGRTVFDRLPRMVGPTALALWLIAGFGAVPVYYEIWLPGEIRENGVELRRDEGGWHVSITGDYGSENAGTSEVDRVMPLLRRLGGVAALTIKGQHDFQDLTLEGLDTLIFVEVWNNRGLQTLEIPQLDALRTLRVIGTDLLRALEIPHLPSLRRLVIWGNDGVRSLEIPQLNTLRRLTIWGNHGLEVLDIPPLGALTSLEIKGNHQLLTLEIPEMESLTYLQVWNNIGLLELEIPWLGALTELEITHNYGLQRLEIPRLASLTTLTITDNSDLPALEIPQINALTSLVIEGNRAVRRLEIPHLGALRSLVIEGNDALPVLRIPQLHRLIALRVEDNEALEVLEIPELESLGSLVILDNERLQTLDTPQSDLEGLMNANGVSPSAPSLEECPVHRLQICLGDTDCTPPSVRCR